MVCRGPGSAPTRGSRPLCPRHDAQLWCHSACACEIPYDHSGEGSSRVPDGGPVVAVFSTLAALPSRLPVGGASQPGLWSCAVDVPLGPPWGGRVAVWQETVFIFYVGASTMVDWWGPPLACQQVLQCVWPYQGPFLDDRLLLLLLLLLTWWVMSSTAGHDDDDDDDDGAVETTRSDARQTSRLGVREEDPCISSWLFYRRPLCLALPLLHALDQRAYATHTRGEGVHEQWHNSAGQQASKAAVHQ